MLVAPGAGGASLVVPFALAVGAVQPVAPVGAGAWPDGVALSDVPSPGVVVGFEAVDAASAGDVGGDGGRLGEERRRAGSDRLPDVEGVRVSRPGDPDLAVALVSLERLAGLLIELRERVVFPEFGGREVQSVVADVAMLAAAVERLVWRIELAKAAAREP